jgi:hypothetical protein
MAIWAMYDFFKYKIYSSYKYFIPFILIVLFFIGNGIVYFDGIDGFIFGELLKIIETIIFIVLLLRIIQYKDIYNFNLASTFKRTFYLFSLFFAILGLAKLLFILFSSERDFLKTIRLDFLGTSLVSDHNIYALYLIIGLIITLYQLFYLYRYDKRGLFYIGFVLLALAIIFAGSRRGFLILLSICTFLFFYVIQKREVLKRGKMFISVLSLFIIVFMLFFSSGNIRLSAITRYKIVENIGLSPKFLDRDLIFLFNKYNSIWGGGGAEERQFNPKNPITWPNHLNNYVFPLSGDGAGKVPAGSVGLKVDSTTRANNWNGRAFSHTKFYEGEFNKGDIIRTVIYCYVSEDFDGKWARVLVNGAIKGNNVTSYNFDNKGQWQKLSLDLNSTGGEVAMRFYVSYPKDSTFRNMNGYVLFAHPEYEVISNLEGEGNGKQEIENDIKQNSLLFNMLNISLFSDESKLSSPRIKRWLYAWKLFKNYSMKEKVIGNGFKYLEFYNKKFYPNTDKIDYPHNPIISSFLYSGIIGGLVYLWFLLTSLYYYYKYRKEFGLLFILYLATGFFVFFSYNSHFSMPAFSMLSVVPFVINYYKKRVESNN